jgi:DNA-binding transcriptional regulator LsrR (DeoR family)
MPKGKGDADVLKVAKLFYEKRMTRQDIAASLKINPRTVSALLQRAHDAEIVEIRIREDVLNRGLTELERLLKAKYKHLDRVLILPTFEPIATNEQHANLIRRFGVLAAQYFETLMDKTHDTVHLAVSGGVSVFEVVNAIQPKSRPNLQIHGTAIVGYGMLNPNAGHLIPAVNASILWQKAGSHAENLNYATAPPLPTDINVLYRTRELLNVIRAMDDVSVVLAGLGPIEPDQDTPSLPDDAKTLRRQLSLADLLEPSISLQKLRDANVVGDFSYNLMTAEGREAKWPDTSRPLRFFLTAGYGTINSGLRFYQNIVKSGGKVIAIAGPFKTKAIRAALKAKVMNIWVTDEETARKILADAD